MSSSNKLVGHNVPREEERLFTLEEFRKKVLGTEAVHMSEEEIGIYYNMSTSFFNLFFDKWKKVGSRILTIKC